MNEDITTQAGAGSAGEKVSVKTGGAGSEAPAGAQGAPSFAAATAPSYGHALFFSRESATDTGREGGSDRGRYTLRPGWGFAFYAVAYYLLQRAAGDVVGWWNLRALRASAVLEFTLFLAAVIPAVVLARVEHRPWSAYGLPLRQAFGKLFWVGALWGFAGITLLLAVLHGLHVFNFGHIVLHGERVVKFAAFWAGTFLVVGLYEEFLLRGYAQFTLARGIGFWPAAVALSCVFGAIHLGNGGEDWRGALAASTIGFFFCLTLRRTGTLWFAVGFHAAWDWGESFFYSVPDSGTVSPGHLLSSSFHGSPWLTGGSVGPEGSVLCFVVMAAAWVAFSKVYPGRGQT
ncbi:MAG TPA: type II CAAX endopeptidase family protein [Candidatus Sulfotelmatobacter sp.]